MRRSCRARIKHRESGIKGRGEAHPASRIKHQGTAARGLLRDRDGHALEAEGGWMLHEMLKEYSAKL
jgi:hypothetical protein